MADDPVPADEPGDVPRLLPFPAGGGGDPGERDPGEAWEGDADDATLSFGDGEDLETAYRRALAAVDDTVDDAVYDTADGAVDDTADGAGPTLAPEPRRTDGGGTHGEAPADAAGGGEPALAGAVPTPRPSPPPARVTPREVVEAALFVGGAGLTAQRAGKLLRGTFTDADLAAAVAELNRRYEAEGRPYRARAGGDGYVLALLPEYEPLRRRLYGLGPREVTLPPDVLETLSVVAYRQPIAAADVDRTRDRPSGAALRRLVRLGVLRLDKPADANGGGPGDGGETKPEPTFATTERFLDLFGLGSLDELPVPADLRFK